MTTSETPPMATPRVAAGALFFDEEGRVLLVKPSYKEGWDIPGGYVEPGESPRAACIREIREELGLIVSIGSHLVVDWAPAQREGDKILFVFDGGVLSTATQESISFSDHEITEWRLVGVSDLEQYLPARLERRVQVAIKAKSSDCPVYAEHGTATN
ncbi:NUDIX domain-containing protein [Actinoplanes rectilineatus]|uniref:NUDIX domain-containing protein n=1 Tax=Actinoplanes rectilineatus TaxID=113571 RepID=UPI001FE0122A|nr:NUDIX hydrolase [Actinoplanes rectilineatus]